MSFQKIPESRDCPWDSSPKSSMISGCPKVVPWDTNFWDSWDWDKILRTGNPVPYRSLEQVQSVFLFYKDCKLIQSLRKKHERFMHLSLQEKNAVRTFFDVKVRRLDKAQKLICRESSIQVVLQFTLIVYQANF